MADAWARVTSELLKKFNFDLILGMKLKPPEFLPLKRYYRSCVKNGSKCGTASTFQKGKF